jgi:hypothetical protein
MHREEAPDAMDMCELRLVESVEQEPMQLRRSPPKLGQLAIRIATKLAGEKVAGRRKRCQESSRWRGERAWALGPVIPASAWYFRPRDAGPSPAEPSSCRADAITSPQGAEIGQRRDAGHGAGGSGRSGSDHRAPGGARAGRAGARPAGRAATHGPVAVDRRGVALAIVAKVAIFRGNR